MSSPSNSAIVPGHPGRTRHIHVKMQAPDEPILTTQLYFPGESQNAGDGLYHDELLMAVETGANGQEARFVFIADLP